jgi:hypothetical protein
MNSSVFDFDVCPVIFLKESVKVRFPMLPQIAANVLNGKFKMRVI